MRLKIYHYPRCSTCKKALDYLAAHDLEYNAVDIVETPPTIKELRKMLGFYKGNIRKLFNTSGILYREMAIKDKLDTMSDDEALKLLSEHGKLVRRPFVIHEKGAVVGFSPKVWDEEIIK